MTMPLWLFAALDALWAIVVFVVTFVAARVWLDRRRRRRSGGRPNHWAAWVDTDATAGSDRLP